MNKKLIIYLLIFTMLGSMAAVFADDTGGDTGGDDGVAEEVMGENETEEDIFDDILNANKQNEEEELIDIGEDADSANITLTKSQSLAISLMKALGVLSKDSDLRKNLTRGELAHAVYTLKGCELRSSSAVNKFADVNADTEYANEISVLYDMGYITGYKGEYRPNDEITAAELAAAIVRLLGLEFITDKKGGWPAGYLTVASTYGVFDGISFSADKKLTLLEAAVIFKNLLNVEIGEEEYTTAGIEGYYMTAVLDISCVEGVVTDNGITSLDGSESRKGIIKIGNVSYNANGVDCEQYIGKKVKIYYRDTAGDDMYVLAVEESDKQDIIHINSEDIDGFSSRVYTYFVSGRSKTAHMSLDYNIIYNGRLVTDGTKLTPECFTPDEGYVELIDQDSDSIYDLVIIEDYITFIVEEYNADTEVLRSQGNKVSEIRFKDADSDIKLLMTDGKTEVKIEYRNIAHNGYVLSVARSLDNKVVKIYLSQESISGFVNSIDPSDKKITVDGKQYTVSRRLQNEITVGGSYKLYINQYGHLIWAERENTTGVKYAYAVKAYFDDDTEKTMVKLYTEDNTYLTAPLKEDVMIDEIRIKDTKKAAAAIQKASETIVRFKINANNEIFWIDTSEYNESAESYADSLNMLYENKTDAAFDQNLLAFGQLYMSRYPTDVNTKVFCVKKPYAEGQIYCYSLADFKTAYGTHSEMNIGELTLYNTDRESMVGRTALVKRSVLGVSANIGNSTSALRTGAVITEIQKAVDEDNEIGYILTVQREDASENIFIEGDAFYFDEKGAYIEGGENPYTLGCGDLIRWGSDNDGKTIAGNVLVLYDCDRDWYNSASTWARQYKYQNMWHYLWVYDKEDDWILTINQAKTPLEKFASGELAYDALYTYVDYTMPLNGKSISIYVYDKEHRELRQSDLGELITYKDAGEGCTKVFGRYNYGHRLYIVYR